mmetsp:Transcript_20726/g.55980  ORF Transcript_20726/g.55980 Transcript_20726/m.55980 type:complete len:296 (+) Transcript_20726:259-1146(+)
MVDHRRHAVDGGNAVPRVHRAPYPGCAPWPPRVSQEYGQACERSACTCKQLPALSRRARRLQPGRHDRGRCSLGHGSGERHRRCRVRERRAHRGGGVGTQAQGAHRAPRVPESRPGRQHAALRRPRLARGSSQAQRGARDQGDASRRAHDRVGERLQGPAQVPHRSGSGCQQIARWQSRTHSWTQSPGRRKDQCYHAAGQCNERNSVGLGQLWRLVSCYRGQQRLTSLHLLPSQRAWRRTSAAERIGVMLSKRNCSSTHYSIRRGSKAYNFPDYKSDSDLQRARLGACESLSSGA